MVLGIGVDILSLSRFRGFIARRGLQRVARRVCCPRELAVFHRLSLPHTVPAQDGSNPEDITDISISQDIAGKQLRFLSTRWAVKEAAYKALYPSLPLLRSISPTFTLSFHTFELTHLGTAPHLRVLNHNVPNGIDGGDAEEIDVIRMMVSVSHDAGVVVGMAVALEGRRLAR